MIENEQITNPNPANPEEFDEANFVPMSAPRARLFVPDKPGWHRHWFRNEPGRIERAMQAGYRFVDPNSVKVIGNILGGPAEESGSTDLGTRVSVAAGGYSDNGQALRLFLMECPQHLYDRNLSALQDITDNTVNALSAGRINGANQTARDASNTYIKGDLPKLFTKKT